MAGIFPVDTDEYEELREAMEKLQLNDASLTWTPESSAALGFGFRCGFLGLLHMEIIQERLEREFNMTVITTVPNVGYRVTTTKGDVMEVHNPSELPDVMHIASIEEPYIKAQVITKAEYTGSIMTLCIDKRGILVGQNYLTTDRVELTFELPLGEVVFDFYDKLKSLSRGYASFDYHPIGLRRATSSSLDILLNGEKVDALSALIHRSHAHELGKEDVRQAEGAAAAADVRHPHPGRHRGQDRGPRNGEGPAQGRDRQVLWRRHQPEAQTAGEAEGGQEENAADRHGRGAAAGVPGGPEAGLSEPFHGHAGPRSHTFPEEEQDTTQMPCAVFQWRTDIRRTARTRITPPPTASIRACDHPRSGGW